MLFLIGIGLIGLGIVAKGPFGKFAEVMIGIGVISIILGFIF